MHGSITGALLRVSPRPIGLVIVATLVLSLLVSACGQDITEPPSGWETAEGRWWQSDVDTSLAFRDMESLEEMGIDESEAASDAAGERQDASDRSLTQVQFAQTIKERLLPLFRNHPEVVDSIFQANVYPEIQELDLSGSLSGRADEFEQEAYSILREGFQEPATRLRLGEDVQITYPDSLRQQGIGGRVRTQVYLNEDGEPMAVKLVESVHPTLDRIGMYAATQMRWNPARLYRDGEGEAIPSWSRFTVNFATQ